jgi:hypothetical protein
MPYHTLVWQILDYTTKGNDKINTGIHCPSFKTFILGYNVRRWHFILFKAKLLGAASQQGIHDEWKSWTIKLFSKKPVILIIELSVGVPSE